MLGGNSTTVKLEVESSALVTRVYQEEGKRMGNIQKDLGVTTVTVAHMGDLLENSW